MKRKAWISGSVLMTALLVGGFLIYRQVMPGKPSSKRVLSLQNITAADFGITQTGEKEWVWSSANLFQYPPQDLGQLIWMLDKEFEALYSNDELVGYRVGGIERCPLFKELGLRNGDVIRSFNNQPIRSFLDMAIRFQRSRQATISVERQHQLITLSYRLQ